MILEIVLLTCMLILLLFLIIFTLSMINGLVRGVPQVGTFGEPKGIMFQELPKVLKSGKKLLDLGSGSGLMARFFSRKCGLHVTGYEIDFGNWLVANVFTRIQRIPNIEYRMKNFYRMTEEEIQEYDYVYIYLFPELMKRIENELVPKMKKGTTIVVNGFPFPNLEPHKTFKRANGKDVIYFYTI